MKFLHQRLIRIITPILLGSCVGASIYIIIVFIAHFVVPSVSPGVTSPQPVSIVEGDNRSAGKMGSSKSSPGSASATQTISEHPRASGSRNMAAKGWKIGHDGDLEESLRCITEALEVSLVLPIESNTVGQEPPYGESIQRVETHDPASQSAQVFVFARDTGELRAFFQVFEEFVAGSGGRSTVSEDEARDIATRGLRALNVDIGLGKVKAKYNSVSGEINDLCGAEWQFVVRRSYQGVPLIDSAVSISVSVTTGEIVQVFNRDVPYRPSNMQCNGTAQDAVAKAKTYLEKDGWVESGSGLEHEPPLKMIVQPNNCFSETRGEFIEREPAAVLAWVIKFLRGGTFGLVFVDAQTGRVIGGVW